MLLYCHYCKKPIQEDLCLYVTSTKNHVTSRNSISFRVVTFRSQRSGREYGFPLYCGLVWYFGWPRLYKWIVYNIYNSINISDLPFLLHCFSSFVVVLLFE